MKTRSVRVPGFIRQIGIVATGIACGFNIVHHNLFESLLFLVMGFGIIFGSRDS